MKRPALLTCLAAGIACVGIARAEPALKQIALGDLTFNYKPEFWRIVPDGEGLVATCLQEDCRGAMIDIGRRDGETGCTREAMLAEVERLFPAERRAYANIYPAGRFALVLAERHDGPTLSFPEYVHGCLGWQGSEYRFAMRPETVGTQTWIGGALHYFVSRASAPEPRIERFRLGAVDFHVSTELWTVDDAGADGIRLICRMPACREPGLTATLTVHHPQQGCSRADDGIGMLEGTETRIEILSPDAPDRLEITISETFLGCRNYVPPGFHACAAHDGRSYHLSTFIPLSCRSSIHDIPHDILIGLMRNARVSSE